MTLLAPNVGAKWRKRGFSRAKREGSECFGASPPVSPPFPHSFLTFNLKTVHSNLQFSPPLNPGFYLWFIVWGGSPEWPKTTSFPGGPEAGHLRVGGGSSYPSNTLDRTLKCDDDENTTATATATGTGTPKTETKQNLCTCITLFCKFLCRPSTTTTSNG